MMSLSIADGTATFTNEHGHVFTASDVAVEPGDVIRVEIAGPYFVVQRDDVEVGRYPMRDSGGWHYEEMQTIVTWSNPFLPPAFQMPVDGGESGRALLSLKTDTEPTEEKRS